MAHIFASDHSSPTTRPPAKKERDLRDTAPEQALAGLQRRADQSGPTARLAQLQSRDAAPVQRLEEEEMLQGKMIQRAEDEDMLQGKMIQRAEDEDMLQGKMIQRAEDEDMLQGKMIQRAEDEDMLQGKMIQRAEDEDMLQGKAVNGTLQREEGAAPASGNGGLPGSLQQGVEQLSGTDMSDVNVHYNSAAPARVGAHAFAQGSDIHLASGQEQHLPHESWHVVQQKQGRVAPTISVAGTPVNDDPGLETEADVMGAKASQLVSKESDA